MLIAIEGDMGKGKTLTAVAFAVRGQEQSGRKIFSTTPLYSAYDCTCGERHTEGKDCAEGGTPGTLHPIDCETLSFDSFYELFKGEREGLESSIIILDEAYLFVDTRSSNSKMNRIFNSFVFQTRKRGVDVLLTTHRLNRLDKRIREGIHLLIRPTHDPRTGVLDLRSKWNDGRTSRAKLRARNYYSHYDTDDVVTPPGKYYRMKREDRL